MLASFYDLNLSNFTSLSSDSVVVGVGRCKIGPYVVSVRGKPSYSSSLAVDDPLDKIRGGTLPNS